MIVYGSSGVTAATRASSSAGSRRAPRCRKSARVIASAGAPSGSITITCSSAGSLARTSAIFATWAASSQNTTRAPESDSTHSHSSGEFVG